MIARGDGNPGNASWGSDLSHLAIDSEVYPGNASEVVGVHHSWAFVPGATVIGRIDRLPA